MKTEQDLRRMLSEQKSEVQRLLIDLREVRKVNSLLEDAVASGCLTPSTSANDAAIAAWFRGKPAALDKRKPGSWFTGEVGGGNANPANDTGGFQVLQASEEPASVTTDAEIAAWFREQQQANDMFKQDIDVDEHKRLKVELPKLHQVSSRQPFMAVLY